jgi:hypothetical protein
VREEVENRTGRRGGDRRSRWRGEKSFVVLQLPGSFCLGSDSIEEAKDEHRGHPGRELGEG